jgi:uncharacterized membrane protein
MHNRSVKTDTTPLAGVVHRNIEALLKVREELELRRAPGERVADAIGNFTGSLPFVYLHAAFFGLWILVNTRVLPIVPQFDPFPFVFLALIASVEAIFLTTFVLITQNRMAQMADKRAELDLQVNLLAEHEVTNLIKMMEATMTHLGVPDIGKRNIDELKSDVDPEHVFQEIVKAEDEAKEEAGRE